MVGEPQPAFGDTGQVQTVLAQLNHYGERLWVPELGGRSTPNSETHDIILSLFGGLSRAERNRLRVRVRTSMRANGTRGKVPRWSAPLRLPARSHRGGPPQPRKGRQGVQLTKLAVDFDLSATTERPSSLLTRQKGRRRGATPRHRAIKAIGRVRPGVGGPTCTRGPRPIVVESPWSEFSRAA